MKKIISIIISAVVFLVALSIIGSCISACASCFGCDSCSSCGSSSCGGCDDDDDYYNDGSSCCDDEDDDYNDGSSCCEEEPEPTPPPPPPKYFKLNLNDGSDVLRDVNIETSRLSESIRNRAGYDFLGVFSDTEGGIQYFDQNGEMMSQPTEGAVLYARWQKMQYTMKFYVNDKVISTRTEIEVEDPVIEFPVPSEKDTPEGYEFEGWECNGRLVSDENGVPLENTNQIDEYYITPSSREIKLTAKFNEIMYKVTYLYIVNGETVYNKSNNVKPNTILNSLPEFPVGDGNTFRGWSFTDPDTEDIRIYNKEPITEDTTFYAVVNRTREVQVYLVDGNGNKEIADPITVDDNGKPLSLSKFEEDIEVPKGYKISGWFSKDNLTASSKIESISYSQDIDTVYCKIDIINYTVTLMLLGDDEECSETLKTYNVERSLILPVPTKPNHTFLGWCDNAELTGTPIKQINKGTTGDLVLYAKFEGVSVKLTMNKNDGGTTTSTKTVKYGTAYTLDVPTRSGYIFLGWFNAATGGTKYTDEKGNSLKKLEDAVATTLYAHWSKKLSINVTVIPSVAGTVTVKDYYLAGDSVKLEVKVKEGYELEGWFRNDELASPNAIYTFEMPENDVSVTAQLRAKTYKVTLDCEGFTQDGTTQNVKFNASYKLPALQKEGETFIGWFADGVLITDASGQSKTTFSSTGDITATARFTTYKLADGEFVYDADALRAMKDAPAKTYQLINDIDMTNEAWTPFSFSGTLEGNNFTIKSLTVNSTATANTGMFTTLSGLVSNINFERLTVSATAKPSNAYGVGGICGEFKSGGIRKVTVLSGSVTVETDNYYVGGLVGIMNGTGILNESVNKASISSKSTVGTGGIVGRLTSGMVITSENQGTVTGKDSVGGILGYVNISQAISIDGDTNSGAVKGTNYVGGVIGNYNFTANTEPKRLTNSGTVTGTSEVGGIAGRVYSSKKLTATDFSNRGNVKGSDKVGGIFGYASVLTASKLSQFEVNATISGDSYLGGAVGMAEGLTLSGKVAESTQTTKAVTQTVVSGRIEILLGTDSGKYIGGYAGHGDSFENITNTLAITYNVASGGKYIGGIAGYATGTFTECTNSAAINANTSDCVGGIAGGLSVSKAVTSTKLTNTGSVSGKNYVGGIVGEGVSTNSAAKLTECAVTKADPDGTVATVITGNTYVGGIAGKLDKITLSDSENTGSTVRAEGSVYEDSSYSTYLGGFVGYGYSFSNLENNVIINSSMSRNYVGGIAGYATGTVSDCTNSASVKATASEYVGGIVGKLDTSAAVAGKNLVSNVAVEGKGYVGGIFGYASSTSNTAKLTSCTVHNANVKAQYCVGSVAGRLDNITLASTETEVTSNTGSTVTATGYLGIEGMKYAYVGGYVGYGYSVSGLTNESDITYDVNCTLNARCVGGIAGYITGSITKCSNSGNISSGESYYVGGVAGYVRSDDSIECNELKNTGDVSGDRYVGGVIGNVLISGTYSFSDFENSGTVTGSQYVGGIFGLLTDSVIVKSTVSVTTYDLTLKTLTNTGVITSDGDYVGGVAGKIEGKNRTSGNTSVKIIISDIYNSGSISGGDCVGGLIGEIISNNTSSTISKFDSTSTVTGTGSNVDTIFGTYSGINVVLSGINVVL